MTKLKILFQIRTLALNNNIFFKHDVKQVFLKNPGKIAVLPLIEWNEKKPISKIAL